MAVNLVKKSVNLLAPLMVLVAVLATSAMASETEVAMFHDALAPYGSWVAYGDYGPVWYPKEVSEEWRPYLNGRWVATAEGWVFETDEAWGWACYHYGNWMPTSQYGWVWVPGSTWYPATVAWRANDEYIGWAPIPPPDYAPAEPFSPPEGNNPEGGDDLLTAPFWTLADAVNFLLGLDQPYGPAYSYADCGCLAPSDYVPDLYPDMPFLPDFYYPGYAPDAIYCFGPPFVLIARITHIDIKVIIKFSKKVNLAKLRHVLPPEDILKKYPFLREAVPTAVREGQRFQVERLADGRRSVRALNRPQAMAPPQNVPPLREEIPKAVLVPSRDHGLDAWKGIKGMKLPQSAVKATLQKRQQAPPERQRPPQPGVETTPAPVQPGPEQPRLREVPQQRRQERRQERQPSMEEQRRVLEERQRIEQQQLLRQRQLQEQMLRRQELLRQQQERQRELQLRRQQELLRQREQQPQPEMQQKQQNVRPKPHREGHPVQE